MFPDYYNVESTKLTEIAITSWRHDNVYQNLINFKHFNLTKLTMPPYSKFQIVPDILENLPNLTYLDVGLTNLKFNTFAKLLPKLEELHLEFNDERLRTKKVSDFCFCEPDTEIENFSLKKINIKVQWIQRIEEVWEILKICPNLEEIKLFDDVCFSMDAKEFFDEKIFEKFEKVQKLKSLTLSTIHLTNFSNFFASLSQNLKKLSRKLETIEVKFFNDFGLKGEFSYDPLTEMLKDDFEVEEDN